MWQAIGPVRPITLFDSDDIYILRRIWSGYCEDAYVDFRKFRYSDYWPAPYPL